jgi:F-type H+-transporting ATPase subunit a
VTLSPDDIGFALGPWRINATLAGSYLVMALLVFGCALLTRALRTSVPLARGQAALEALVSFLGDQIRAVTEQDPKPYLPFVGTLFLFIALSNILAVVPGFIAPTSSLSTAAALALCVFVAVPFFGIRKVGVRAYLANYLQPTPWLLPFTLIGELSRTLALAVRLFGNAMSSSVIAAILLLIAPLLFPVVMQAFGLLIGFIQAYIFSILAIVYIASGSEVQAKRLAPRGREDA